MTWDRLATAVGLRVRSLARRDLVERELDEELAFHLEQLTRRHMVEGVPAEQARALAIKALGGVALTKEKVRDTRRVRLLEDLGRDLRTAWRSMRRQAGPTALMLLTLAVGLGATTAVFGLVNGVLLRRPYPDVDRIMWVLERNPRGDLSAVSTLNFFDWRDQNRSFDTLASWGFGSLTLSGVPVPLPLRAAYVGEPYFRLFALRPELGRAFTADDQQPGHDQVAIISHELWRGQFGGDPGIVGRNIRLRDQPFAIVGVMPESASASEWGWTQIWVPQVLAGESNRAYRSFNVYGKLRPGVSVAAARAEMDALAAQLCAAYPDSNKGWGVTITPYMEMLGMNGLRASLVLMFGAVGVLLLIAAVNLANMMLVRALAREQECAIRSALGGGRGRLLRQFLTESLLTALAGAALGLGVAVGLLAAIRALLPMYSSPGRLPPQDAVVMDGRVFLFALAVSVLMTVIFGVIPARAALRGDLVSGLKGGRPGQSTADSARVRRGLVVAEVTLAFVLLATAAVLVTGFVRLQRADTGFDPTNVVTAQLPLPPDRTADRNDRERYLDRVLAAVKSVPGVQDAAFTSVLPLQGWGTEVPVQATDASTPQADRPTGFFKMVTPGYFPALSLTLRRGRLLQDTDRSDTPRVAVINETMMRTVFNGRDPVGQQLLIPELVTTGRTRFGPDLNWEVIGVIADERVTDLKDARVSPGVYVPLTQSTTRRPSLVVRGAGARPQGGLDVALRRAVASVNPDQPLAELKTLQAMKDDSLGSDRQRSWAVAVFAGVALLLAGIGIYGVLACVVLQRQHELGVRAALGATAGRLARVVMREGGVLIAIGLALGLALSQLLNAVLAGRVFGIAPASALLSFATVVILMLVGLAACLAPARRAMRANPLAVLRGD